LLIVTYDLLSTNIPPPVPLKELKEQFYRMKLTTKINFVGWLISSPNHHL